MILDYELWAASPLDHLFLIFSPSLSPFFANLPRSNHFPTVKILAQIVLLSIILLASTSNNLLGQRPATSKKSTAKSGILKVYLNVPAQPGDLVEDLLKRYGLHDFGCNLEHFFKINSLKENARLKTGTSYKLPVEVITYNGKSIRSTLNISDWKVAKRIETYNKFALNEGLRPDNFIETKRLWVPWHELNCPEKSEAAGTVAVASVKVPAKNLVGEKPLGKGSRIFPIFGKKYQHTPLASQKLKGKVFYIVSGHGGPDSGAQGKRVGRTLCEDEYAYDVSLRLLRLLLSHGAAAYMIVRDPNDGIRDTELLLCDQDEKVWGDLAIPLEQKARLQQRCDIINNFTTQNAKAGATDQTLVEIHVDSRTRDTKTDVFFYYRPESEPSRKLALRIHQTFLQKYLKKRSQRGYNGSVTPRYLYMLKETTTPKAVYIELGNIRNDWDQQRLVLKNNRQAVANWLCEALMGN